MSTHEEKTVATTKTILKDQKPGAASRSDAIAAPNSPVALACEKGCDVAPPTTRQPADACNEAIRTLAYHNWEAAGCPAGDGVDFWLEAEREINTVGSSLSS